MIQGSLSIRTCRLIDGGERGLEQARSETRRTRKTPARVCGPGSQRMKLGEGSVSRSVGPGSRGGKERGPDLDSLVSLAFGPTIDYLKPTGLVDICQPGSSFPRLELAGPRRSGSERK